MSVRTSVALEKVGPLLEGRDENPFDLLGPHEVVAEGRRALAVRAFLPGSAQAWVVDPGHPCRSRCDGFIRPDSTRPFVPMLKDAANNRYMLRVTDERAPNHEHDPYAFPPLLSDFDLYLLGEGKHWNSYQQAGRPVADASMGSRA